MELSDGGVFAVLGFVALTGFGFTGFGFTGSGFTETGFLGAVFRAGFVTVVGLATGLDADLAELGADLALGLLDGAPGLTDLSVTALIICGLELSKALVSFFVDFSLGVRAMNRFPKINIYWRFS